MEPMRWLHLSDRLWIADLNDIDLSTRGVKKLISLQTSQQQQQQEEEQQPGQQQQQQHGQQRQQPQQHDQQQQQLQQQQQKLYLTQDVVFANSYRRRSPMVTVSLCDKGQHLFNIICCLS